MRRWALLSGAVCANVVEQAEMPSIPGEWRDVTGLPVGPGSRWSGSEWLPPVTAQSPTAWLIDVGPFFDRFEAAKFGVLTSAHVGVQAVVKDAQTRKWIDLQHPAVAQGVDVIISAGIPGVDAPLKARILTRPVTEAENFALRKVYFGG